MADALTKMAINTSKNVQIRTKDLHALHILWTTDLERMNGHIEHWTYNDSDREATFLAFTHGCGS